MGALDIDARKAIVGGVVALGLVAAVVAVVGEVTSFGDMTRALAHAHKPWFVACLGGELLAYVGYIGAYRDVARTAGGPRFSPWVATRVVVLGLGAFVAAASAGSLGVDYWALHQAGQRPHQAARRVLALNTLEWAFLSLAAAGAAIAVAAGRGAGAPVAMEIAWLVAVPACFAAAVYVSSPVRAERLATRPSGDADGILDRVGRAVRSGFADAVAGVVIVRRLAASPLQHVQALAGFPLFWAGDVFVLDAALHAFGVQLALTPLVLAYASAYVLTSLPLPAGGSGGVEAGLAFALRAVGVPLAPALLATLVYRFFTVWLPIVPALALLPRLQPLRRELERLAST